MRKKEKPSYYYMRQYCMYYCKTFYDDSYATFNPKLTQVELKDEMSCMFYVFSLLT